MSEGHLVEQGRHEDLDRPGTTLAKLVKAE
jgi:hypothetical protein